MVPPTLTQHPLGTCGNPPLSEEWSVVSRADRVQREDHIGLISFCKRDPVLGQIPSPRQPQLFPGEDQQPKARGHRKMSPREVSKSITASGSQVSYHSTPKTQGK